jgi:hypothetical protein
VKSLKGARWRLGGIVAIIALLAGPLGIPAAVAQVAGQLIGGPGPVQIAVAGSGSAVTTSSVAWFNLPNAQAKVAVPPNQQGLLVARFTAETACYNTTANTQAHACRARILLDGAEMRPVVGTDFALDSTDQGKEGRSSWEGHAMQRFSACVASGSHTAQVQVSTSDPQVTFHVDDYVLTLERYTPCEQAT